MKIVCLKQKIVIVLFAFALCFGMLGFGFQTVTNAGNGDYLITSDMSAYINCAENKNVEGFKEIAAPGMQSATSVYGKTDAEGESFVYHATTFDSSVTTNGNRKDLSYENAAIEVPVYVYDSTLQDGAGILGKGEIKVGIASDFDDFTKNWGDYRYWKNTLNTWDGNKLYNAKWNILKLGVEWLHSGANSACWMTSANEIGVFSIQIPNLGGTTHVLIGDIKMTTGTDAAVNHGEVVKYDEFTGPKFEITGGSQRIVLGNLITSTLTGINTSDVSELSVKANYNGTEQTFTELPATVTFTPNAKGDYIVKYDVSYSYGGETITLSQEKTYSVIELDTSVKIDITDDYGIEHYTSFDIGGSHVELTEINAGLRYYNNDKYVYAKSNGKALKFGFVTQIGATWENDKYVDLSSVNADGYGALSFYVWVSEDAVTGSGSKFAQRADQWFAFGNYAVVPTLNLQGGKLQRVIIRMSDCTDIPAGDFSFEYFCTMYLQIGSKNLQMLIGDVSAIVTDKSTGVYDATDFIPDLTAPEFDFGTYGGDEQSTQNLAISTRETNYKATATLVKSNETVLTLDFTDADMSSVLGAVKLSSGIYTYNVTISDIAGNSTTKSTAVTITGKPQFRLDATSSAAANEDFEITLDYDDFGGVSDISIVVKYENVTSDAYNSLPLIYTINHAAGEVEVTFEISYLYNNDDRTETKTQTITFVDTSVSLELTKDYVIENYTTYQPENIFSSEQWAWLTELNQGFRYFDGERFVYVKSNGAAVRFGVITKRNILLPDYPGTVDLSSFNESGFGAFTFLVWSDKDVNLLGRNTVIASRSDIWYQTAHNAKSSKDLVIQGGKLQRVVIRMSDFVNTFDDNKFDYSAFALMFMQISDSKASMLFGDISVITTLQSTGVYDAEEFNPDLTPPAMTAPVATTGAYNEFVGILPTIEDVTKDYSVVAEIYYNGKIAQTITAAKSELAEKLGTYTFITGGTYNVKYTLTETESKNFSELEVAYTITGINSEICLRLDTTGFVTDYYEGSAIDLSGLKVVNWFDQNVEFSATVTDKDGNAVTLENNSFVGAIGTYTIKVTANSGEYSIAENVTVNVISIDDGSDDNGDNNDSEETEKKSGCKSSINTADGAIAAVAILGVAVIAFKKRKEM